MEIDRCPDCRAGRYLEQHLTRTCLCCGREDTRCAGCCHWTASALVTRQDGEPFCLRCKEDR